MLYENIFAGSGLAHPSAASLPGYRAARVVPILRLQCETNNTTHFFCRLPASGFKHLYRMVPPSIDPKDLNMAKYIMVLGWLLIY